MAGRLSWRRLLVLVRHLPRESALHRSMHGEMADWGPSEYLAAMQADALNAANWQRSGGKGRRPKPVPRPKPTKPPAPERRSGAVTKDVHVGRAAMSTTQLDRRLEAARQRELARQEVSSDGG